MLTTEQVEQFQRDGYLLGPRVLDEAQVATLREELQRVIENHDTLEKKPVRLSNLSGDAGAPVWQVVNIWEASEPFRALVAQPVIAEEIAQLTGARELRLWHDQTLVKPPGAPMATPIHQDLPYWPMESEEAITAWTALDDVDERNSCMHYVPRSHTWGKYPGNDFRDPDEIAQMAPEHAHECTPVTAPVPAGSVIFHHSLTFHGATPNVTDKARRAMIIHYMADGMRFNGAGHIVTGLLSLTPGQPMTNDEVWPIIATA